VITAILINNLQLIGIPVREAGSQQHCLCREIIVLIISFFCVVDSWLDGDNNNNEGPDDSIHECRKTASDKMLFS